MATVHLQVKMLSMLDTKLPYCPVNTQAKVASEKVYWEGIAVKNVFDRFKSLDVVRPKIVLPFDPNEFVVVDAKVTKEEAAKTNGIRKKFHDHKFKCYEQDVIAYEDRLRRAVAAEVVVLMDSAKDIVWITLLPTLGDNFKYVSSLSGLCDVPALLDEINTSMHSDFAHDKLLTRKQLSAATFENEGCCLLPKWKYYVNFMTQRLSALGSAVL